MIAVRVGSRTAWKWIKRDRLIIVMCQHLDEWFDGYDLKEHWSIKENDFIPVIE